MKKPRRGKQGTGAKESARPSPRLLGSEGKEYVANPVDDDDARDELRHILEDWKQAANETIRFLKKAPADDRSARLLVDLSRKQLDEIKAALDAADFGGWMWVAMRAAALAGLYAGLMQQEPNIYHARRKLRLELDRRASERRRRVESGQQGGRPSNLDRPRIADAWRGHEQEYPNLSQRARARVLGKRFSVSASTILRALGKKK